MKTKKQAIENQEPENDEDQEVQHATSLGKLTTPQPGQQVVWRFKAVAGQDTTSPVPVGARFFGVRGDFLTTSLYALCDPFAPKVPRTFRSVGTGQPFHVEGFVPIGSTGGGYHIFVSPEPVIEEVD